MECYTCNYGFLSFVRPKMSIRGKKIMPRRINITFFVPYQTTSQYSNSEKDSIKLPNIPINTITTTTHINHSDVRKSNKSPTYLET